MRFPVRTFATSALKLPRVISKTRSSDKRLRHLPVVEKGHIKGMLSGGDLTRSIVAEEEGFVDDFVGTDTYGYESRAPEGDLFGFVRDPDRELARMIKMNGLTSYHNQKIGCTNWEAAAGQSQDDFTREIS